MHAPVIIGSGKKAAVFLAGLLCLAFFILKLAFSFF